MSMYKILGGDGKEYGPVPAETLRQWMNEGRANTQTQVQAEGTTGWVALGSLPEFAPPPAAAAQVAGAAPTFVGQPKVPNYLVQSILVTLCCCLPLGIPAIIFAAQVNSKQAAGDLAGAEEASRKAKLWCWIAFGLGLVANLIVGVIQVIAIAGSRHSL